MCGVTVDGVLGGNVPPPDRVGTGKVGDVLTAAARAARIERSKEQSSVK
jgi:hypothetical protein